jgi:hypothetical protein
VSVSLYVYFTKTTENNSGKMWLEIYTKSYQMNVNLVHLVKITPPLLDNRQASIK